jgi:arsenate reductase
MADVMNIAFFCTSNCGRSIMAEAIPDRESGGRCKGWSGGSRQAGAVTPIALGLLEKLGHATAGRRSRSWQECLEPGAPELDVVITLCAEAAGEPRPDWPGALAAAHWGIAHPIRFAAGPSHRIAETYAVYEESCRQLHNRISLFLSLPFATLDAMRLRHHLGTIHRA